MSKAAQKFDFDRSPELKKLFNEQYDLWKKKYRGSMEDLAQRIGVSASYLGHIGRYGRIPGKPILILLSMNFEMEHPWKFYEAAGIDEPWPYEEGTRMTAVDEAAQGLLSVKLDMKGFTETIRDVVRTEMRPRSLRDLTRGRPLRVGVNVHQDWLFRELDVDEVSIEEGFFPELIKLLGISLHTKVEFEDVRYSEYEEKLFSGEIDVFGPVYATHLRVGTVLHTKPFCKVGISALGRKRKARNLEELPLPRNIRDLTKTKYKLSVLRDSQAHHFATVRLGYSDEDLVLCDSGDEALERIILANIKRPAHLMLCDSTIAVNDFEAYQNELELLFATRAELLDSFDDTIAVRPDWPELVTSINETLGFLKKNESLADLFWREVPEKMKEVVVVPDA